MARELVGASRGPHVTGHMFLHFLNIGEFVYLSFRLGILCTQTKSPTAERLARNIILVGASAGATL